MTSGLLTACTSSNARTTSPALFGSGLTPPDTAVPSATGGSATDTGYTDAGTWTVTGTGDTVTSQLSVGQPTQSPPADVVDACNWSAGVNMSVYIPATLTITYTGTIAETVSVLGQTAAPVNWGLGTSLINDSTAIDTSDGSGWADCQNPADNVWQATLTPGQTITAPVWLAIQDIISNATPSLTSAQQAAIQFGFYAAATDQTIGTATTVTGPHAAHCVGGGDDPFDTLLPYATLPATFTVQQVAGTDTLTCSAPS